MNTATTNISLPFPITPAIAQQLQSSIEDLTRQFVALSATNLCDPANLKSLEGVSRILRTTVNLLTPTKTSTTATKAALTSLLVPTAEPPRPAPEVASEPTPAPASAPASAPAPVELPPSLPAPVATSAPSSPETGSLAAIRKLPDFPEFQQSFIAAHKARRPGISRSQINMHLQDLLRTLAKNPQLAPLAIQYIQASQTHTTPFAWELFPITSSASDSGADFAMSLSLPLTL